MPSKPAKITEFDTPTVRDLQREIEEALKPIAAKYGLQVERNGRTYQPHIMPVMFQFAVVGEEGADSKEAREFLSHCTLFGFVKEDLGKTFSTSFQGRNSEFQVFGLAPRSTKYPVIVKRISDGELFKFTAVVVKNALKAKVG